MQTAFARKVDYVPTFDGNRDLPEQEQIKVKLTSLSTGDFFDIVTALGNISNEKGEIDLGKAAKDGLLGVAPLLAKGANILPRYTEISGLLDAAGNPVTPAEVAAAPFFLGLTAELLGKLAEISAPKMADLKN